MGASGLCHDHQVTSAPFQLRSLEVGDDPGAWIAAGFSVDTDRVLVGNTMIRLLGTSGERGIVSAGVDGDVVSGNGDGIDGLPFRADTPDLLGPAGDGHRNRVVAFDHLVAMSPDVDRTTDMLTAAGLSHRRTRRFEAGGRPMRQEFFWLGDVILELAGGDDTHEPGPARLWGLALTCADLEAAAADLGPLLGPSRPAVQKGRRIATMRTRDLDISVPIALLSPHGPSGS